MLCCLSSGRQGYVDWRTRLDMCCGPRSPRIPNVKTGPGVTSYTIQSLRKKGPLSSRTDMCSPTIRDSRKMSRQYPSGFTALGTFMAEMCPVRKQAKPKFCVGVCSPRAFARKRDGEEAMSSSLDVPSSIYKSGSVRSSTRSKVHSSVRTRSGLRGTPRNRPAESTKSASTSRNAVNWLSAV